MVALRIKPLLLTGEDVGEYAVRRGDGRRFARRRPKPGWRDLEWFVATVDGYDSVVDRRMHQRDPQLRALDRLCADRYDRVLRDGVPMDDHVWFFGLSERLS